MKQRPLGRSGLTASRMGLGCMGMSEFYGPGRNEVLVGKAIRDRRGKSVLATKFGNVHGTDGAWLGVNGKPEYVRVCCEDSLRRLGVDTIDLYYQHRVDPDTPMEETVGAKGERYSEQAMRALNR